MAYNIQLLSSEELAVTPSSSIFTPFNPTELEIHFINSFTTVENEQVKKWVRVDTVVTEQNSYEDGTFKNRTQRLTHHTFPFEIWEAAVSGIDLETGKFSLNENVLNQICKTFGVKIV